MGLANGFLPFPWVGPVLPTFRLVGVPFLGPQFPGSIWPEGRPGNPELVAKSLEVPTIWICRLKGFKRVQKSLGAFNRD